MSNSWLLTVIATAAVMGVFALYQLNQRIAEATKAANAIINQLREMNHNQSETRAALYNLATHVLHAGEGRRELIGDMPGLPPERIDINGHPLHR